MWICLIQHSKEDQEESGDLWIRHQIVDNMTADETPSFNGTKREIEDVILNILHCFLTVETKKGTSSVEIITAEQISA